MSDGSVVNETLSETYAVVSTGIEQHDILIFLCLEDEHCGLEVSHLDKRDPGNQ